MERDARRRRQRRPAPGGQRARTGDGGHEQADETAAAATVLRAAGWYVIRLEAGTPIATAWQQLPRAAEMLVPGATLGGHDYEQSGTTA